ncbi:ABC-type transport auxiliary lipoprotein family protein [Pinisolibacter sp.]|uniref:ABC-type transport auxiliary lipoprotein family protein n=1 Tax=Pinisolibacter sp. TaxID=2172024 RepID=UPI002FDDC4C6
MRRGADHRRAKTAGRAFAALGLAAVLAGCSAVMPTPSADTYDLSAPATTTPPRGRSLQILVAEPAADRALDTERIVVRPSATEIAYFSGAQWSDRLPRLVQSRLVGALEASGRFRAAGRPGQGLAIDRQIVTEIRAFDYEAGEGRVVIALSMKLMDDRTGRVLATRAFRAEEPATDSAKAAVAAFDRAQARLMAEIVAWAGQRG